MQYVVILLETESDTPGVVRVLGPYVEPMAERMKRLSREVYVDLGRDPELVQMAQLTTV